MWVIAGVWISIITVVYGTVQTVSSAVSSNPPSTITPAPTVSSSAPVVPVVNTCSFYNTTAGVWQWNDPWCSIQAGTVQLTFWPTNDNLSYPATVYNSELDYTFTSPSVYMVINTVYGYNPCGPLGPTGSNVVFPFDLTDVSTLVPYTDETATTRRQTRQLYLSDLATNCDGNYDIATLTTATHPLKDEANRCNPSLVIPGAIKKWGRPYWNHCGNVGNKFGLFDPPYAVTPEKGLFVSPGTTTVATTEAPESTQVASKPAETTAKTLSTQITDAQPATSTNKAKPPSSENATPSQGSANSVRPQPSEDSPVTLPADHPTTTILTPPVSTIAEQVVSLGTAGLEVVNSGVDGTSTYIVPSFGATEAGSSVAAASVAVYQGHTLTVGGPAATVTEAVVLLPTDSSTGSTIPNITATTPVVVTASSSRCIGGLFRVASAALVAWCLM